MNVLIVDDERHARKELERLLKDFPDIHIAGEAVNAREARERIEALHPDLVFLDIQMPEETGFELLESLGNSIPRIIFTTAYDAFALRAFDFGAVDYLLKPIGPRRLALALQRACQTDSPGGTVEDLDAPIPESPVRPLALADKVLLGGSDRIAYVTVASIVVIEALGSYSKIWVDDQFLVIRRSLAALEARLPTEFFMRANRSQLINLQQIQAVEPWFSGGMKMKLKGDLTVELSRRQAKVFRERNSL